MKKYEQLCWRDLFDLQNKFEMISHYIKIYTEGERSQEMRESYLKSAGDIANTGSKDIDYLADTRLINEKRAMNLPLSIDTGDK